MFVITPAFHQTFCHFIHSCDYAGWFQHRHISFGTSHTQAAHVYSYIMHPTQTQLPPCFRCVRVFSMTVPSQQLLQMPGFRHRSEVPFGGLPLLQNPISLLRSFCHVEPTPWSPTSTWKRKPNMRRTNGCQQVQKHFSVSESIKVLSIVPT